MREGKVALEHLLWSLGHEEPLRAAHPHRPVQVLGRIVIEVGSVTLPILILEGGDVSVLVVRLLVDGAVGVDDEQSGLTVVRRASRVDPCPSALVKVSVVPSGLCRSLRIIVRDPSPIPLQDAHDGVALIVAHPQVALFVIVESRDAHKILSMSIVGQDAGQRRVVHAVMIRQFVVLELVDARTLRA